MAVALAVLAALLFAVGTVLQHRVATAEPEHSDGSLLARLVRRPLWLTGVAADALGFGAQAAALAAGQLAIVQPLLAGSLVFTLPLAAALERRRVERRSLCAALAVTTGLALFLVLADPAGGRGDATIGAWAIAAVLCAAAVTAAGLSARGAPPARRAALLGAGTGVLFGLCAALTKATMERLDGGVLHVLADWHVYALLAVGYASMALAQASLQTGRLGLAVATQMALDPVTSLLLGTLAFGERLDETAIGAIGASACVALAIAGIAVLGAQTAEAPSVTRERE